MPDDKKVPAKPRYKVEEVESDAPDTPKEMPVEEKKITSFSMVDAPIEEKVVEEKPLTDSETHPVVDTDKAEEEDTTPAETSLEPVAGEPHEHSVTEPEEPEENDEIKKWLEHTPSDMANTNTNAGGGKGKFVALFLGILIIAALGGGIYYYRANVEQDGLAAVPSKEESQETTNETPQVTESPTPTVVAIDYSKYKVQILNGGGVPGEAGKAQGYLESVGFKSFKTGNASAFTYIDTEVSMKKDIPEEVFTKVKETLEKQYQGVVKSDKVLADSSEFDLQITVGKKK